MGKRRCKAKTKVGKACRGTPIAATSFEFCVAHSPAEVRESLGFIAQNGRGGRPSNPKPLEVLQERVEGEVDKWLQPYEEGLTAERHVVVGNGPTAHVEAVPDIPTRMRASDAVLDRIYGRPTQRTESESEVTITTQTEFDREVNELVDRVKANANRAKAGKR